jgi:hypothetical protein
MILGGGPQPHRAGHRVRLLLRACLLRAARRRLRDHHGQQQSGNRQHRLRHQRPAVFRTADLEDVLHIYRNEKCWGAIVQFGGPDAAESGARSGAQRRQHHRHEARPSIEAAEDRKFFQELVTSWNPAARQRHGRHQRRGSRGDCRADRLSGADAPSFVLGGRAMVIVYDRDMLRSYMQEAVEVSEERPADRSLP